LNNFVEKEEAIRKIALARFEAREKWLQEHGSDISKMTSYVHAHGIMANLEAGIAEGWQPEDCSVEQYLEYARQLCIERWGVDTSALPGE
jgi:hypothetical protein